MNEAPKNTDSTKNDPENLTVEQVRQGQTGTGLRYVLMISLIAAALALAAVFAIFAE